MATIACPECGLPRAEDQIDHVPCPVCNTTQAAPVKSKLLVRPGAASHDPTANLPADVSELGRHPREQPPASGGMAVMGAFVAGIGVGVAAILGWQLLFPDSETEHSQEFAREKPAPSQPLPVSSPVSFANELAPMPHARAPEQAHAPERSVPKAPAPPPEKPSLPPLKAIVIDLHQPDATYVVPFTMLKGEYVIIRGKVKTLRAGGLSGGAVLDASGLEAGSIFIGGTVDGRSSLHLNAPVGAVTIAARISGQSHLEIRAGNIRFSSPTIVEQPGSLIDDGSTVSLAGRSIDIRGDITGAGTRVNATLPPGGSLRVAAIRGTAIVEYAVEPASGTMPEISAGFVAPTATLRKRN